MVFGHRGEARCGADGSFALGVVPMDRKTRLLLAHAARIAADALEHWARHECEMDDEFDQKGHDEAEQREVQAALDLAKRRGLL